MAIVRGQMEKAVVVLGSATPSLKSHHNAKKGKTGLLKFPERVDDQKMPRVRVVDLRQAAFREKGDAFSRRNSTEAVRRRLDPAKTTMLLYQTSAVTRPRCNARDPFQVATCPNCSGSLTYHLAWNKRLPAISAGSWTRSRSVVRTRNAGIRASAFPARAPSAWKKRWPVFIPWRAGVNVSGLTPEIPQPLPSGDGGPDQAISRLPYTAPAQLAQNFPTNQPCPIPFSLFAFMGIEGALGRMQHSPELSQNLQVFPFRFGRNKFLPRMASIPEYSTGHEKDILGQAGVHQENGVGWDACTGESSDASKRSARNRAQAGPT